MTQREAKTFLPLLRAAVAAQPDRDDLRRDLTLALIEDGQWNEILADLAPTARSGLLSPRQAWEFGMAASAGQDWESARSALASAVSGAVPGALRQMAFVLNRLGETEKALEAGRRALKEDPYDNRILEMVAKHFLKQGDGALLIALCDDLSAQTGGTATELAYRALALAASGRTDAVDSLVDYATWCRCRQIGRSAAEDEEAAAAVMNHPALAPSGDDKPTQGRSLRLRHLADCPEPAIKRLIADVREQINAYVRERVHLAHPVAVRRPAGAMLNGWALAVMDDGHEPMHIHPGGWLSASYYLRTPGAVDDAGGRVVFGPWPGEWEDILPDYPRHQVRPGSGDLLIFPSFMGHRTTATGVPEPRLCAVLDVIPHRAA